MLLIFVQAIHVTYGQHFFKSLAVTVMQLSRSFFGERSSPQ